MEGKICTKCGELKEYDEFHRRSSGSIDGYNGQCKVCRNAVVKKCADKNKYYKREYDKQRRTKNEEHMKVVQKEWYYANRENILASAKQYRIENREHVKAVRNEWYENNKERMQAYQKQWYVENKEHVQSYHKQYNHQKYVCNFTQ